MATPKKPPEAKAEKGEAEKDAATTQATNELKVVIAVKDDRVMLGVQAPECDPIYETSQGTLESALKRVPAFVKEAKRKWAKNPRNPEAEMPEPPPESKPALGPASSGSRGKSSQPKEQPLMF